MSRGRRSALAGALCLLLSIGLAGCGVGETDRPVDLGDALADGGASNDALVREPPLWSADDSPLDVVRNFLQTAAGGSSTANDRMKQYLTSNALTEWQDPVPADNPSLSVIRIVSGPDPGTAIGERTPFTVTYQTMGTLTDLGRVDELPQFVTRTLTFWVVPVPEQNFGARIDRIDDWPEGQLLLSDVGLRTYYQAQPIYFWDLGAQLLVPDVRYLPLSQRLGTRANTVLRWLTTGPSPWLGGVQRLPTGTTHENVVTQADGAMVVDLSAEAAGTGDPEALNRLIYQLRWSLSGLSSGGSEPEIELRISNLPQSIDADEGAFRQYNHSWTLREPRRFDISSGVVVAGDGSSAAVLAMPENSNVMFAAIDRDGTAAFVRSDSFGRHYLQILNGDLTVQETSVPHLADLGRPSFVPGTDFVLIPTGGNDGRLLAVSRTEGTYTDASHGLTGITAAAISPDGRRIAVVADEGLYTASLIITGGNVELSTPQRQLLAGQLSAHAVTWLSESWLEVGGTRSGGSAPALWKVSADGVLTEDLSATMSGLQRVDDLVCYPQWTARNGSPDVYASTPQGLYVIRNGPSQALGLVAPFYGS